MVRKRFCSILEWSEGQKNVRRRSRGEDPPSPHIGDYVIHFEASIFGILVPRSSRDLVFVMSVTVVLSKRCLKNVRERSRGRTPPPYCRSVRSNGSIIFNGSNRSNRSKAFRFPELCCTADTALPPPVPLLSRPVVENSWG